MMSGANQQRICAIRLPGTSRARFIDAGTLSITLGDWVTIDFGAGEEPGQIVVAPDQWLEPVAIDDVPTAIRTLDEDDLETIAEAIRRARELIPAAAEVVRSRAPGHFLSGLRMTLAGDRVIAAYIGEQQLDPDVLEPHLTEALSIPVSIEQEGSDRPEKILLGGSTRLPGSDRPDAFREMVEQRFDVLRDPDTFAPHGMPRLGSTVETPHGEGKLIAIDIRHWKATVTLATGEDVEVGVEELRQPGT